MVLTKIFPLGSLLWDVTLLLGLEEDYGLLSSMRVSRGQCNTCFVFCPLFTLGPGLGRVSPKCLSWTSTIGSETHRVVLPVWIHERLRGKTKDWTLYSLYDHPFRFTFVYFDDEREVGRFCRLTFLMVFNPSSVSNCYESLWMSYVSITKGSTGINWVVIPKIIFFSLTSTLYHLISPDDTYIGSLRSRCWRYDIYTP